MLKEIWILGTPKCAKMLGAYCLRQLTLQNDKLENLQGFLNWFYTALQSYFHMAAEEP